MAVAKQLTTWLRHTFSWSTSRQSWEERVGLLLLLAGGLTAWAFSSRMTVLQNVLAWGAIAVTAAVLLRRGWLVLFGPVLFYEMIRSARRGRYFLLRCLYAGLLLFILFCTWMPYAFERGWHDPSRAALMALRFFEMFMLVQLIAVTVLTPAYVGGAISEEKDRKTLEFLLATDLRNREIVLSKVGARLANLGLFVLTGLPILGFLQLIGGVDPTLVIAGFAATGLTMLGLAGISILNSVYFKRPRDSIAITYLMLLTYIALATTLYGLKRGGVLALVDSSLDVTYLVDFLNSVRGWFGGTPWSKTTISLSDLVDVLNAGNLLAMIIEIGEHGSLIAPNLVIEYAWYHGVLTVVCLVWAIVRLRRIALRQAFGRVQKAGARHAARPPVGVMPMLWKEVSVEGGLRLNWIAAIILAILFLLSLAPVAIMIGYLVYEYLWLGRWGGWEHRGFVEGVNIWVRVVGSFVGALLLLAVAVRASTSIGIERDKQTLDSLLTSPLDSNAILWGKFMGSLLSIRVGWVWLGLIWGIGVLTGGLHVFALPVLLLSWFVFAAFLTMLGLWFSMTCRTTMRATVYTVLGTVFLWAGHWLIWLCCIPLFAVGVGRHTENALEYVAKFQAGLTMPVSFFSFSYMEANFGMNWDRELVELIPFALMGLFIWVVLSVIFWFGILSPRFRTFTMRQDERFPEADYYPEHEEEPRRRSGPPPLPDDAV